MATAAPQTRPEAIEPEAAPVPRAVRTPDGAPYRLTADQVERMTRAGILIEGDPIVLLDGLLVTKMTKGDPHIATAKLLQDALRAILPAGWHVAKEDPILLPEGPARAQSLPEPDVTILRGSIRDYLRRKPVSADIGLVVEVADTTLRKDRKMLARYAWVGIPIVWVVNLQARSVEVHTGPSGPGAEPGYRVVRAYGEGEEVPVVLDGAEAGRIAVRDILP